MAAKKKSAKKSAPKTSKASKGEHVLIRANQAGVIFGEYEGTAKEGNHTFHVLKNSRKIHYWNGAAACDELAVYGINPNKAGSRVCVVVPTRKIRTGVETAEKEC